MALLHAMARTTSQACRNSPGQCQGSAARLPAFSAVSINHGLRSESSSEVEFVRDFALAHGVRTQCRALHLVAGRRSRVMASARQQRYRELAAAAEAVGASAVLTAHHAGA